MMSLPRRTVKIVLLAAHISEVRPLFTLEGFERCGADEQGLIGHLSTSLGTVAVYVTGVGLVDAAVGTHEALATYTPERAIWVGSCGVYPGVALQALDIVICKSHRLVESALLENQAALPDVMISHATHTPSWIAELSSYAKPLVLVDATTTLGITTADPLALAYASVGAQVENMEGFAFARACERRGVQSIALLGVTNVVGGEGRTAWKLQHGICAERVCALIAGWLGARTQS